MSIDPEVAEIFDEQTKNTSRKHIDMSGKPRKLDWHDEAERALAGNRPDAIAKTIRKVYEMAGDGNMEAIKVVLDRDFGKVTTPFTLDTENASTAALTASLKALSEPEGGSATPDP